MAAQDITVVGACNIDLISYVPRLPVLGETLHGSKFQIGFGGKGANQAVMAAKLGSAVAMVSKVGDDVFGRDTIENFKKLNVDVSHLGVSTTAFSGVAPIAVDAKGNNSIIIVNGANDEILLEEVSAAEETIAASKIVVTQGEIPIEISVAAMRLARKHKVTSLFNPAPARSDFPKEALEMADIVCPNETETELLTGMPVTSLDETRLAARKLLEMGARAALITLGSRGALYVDATEDYHVAATPVDVVMDTTGAGDSFIGSLAHFLTRGWSMRQAIVGANKVAGISVQGSGTQTSFPMRADVPFLNE